MKILLTAFVALLVFQPCDAQDHTSVDSIAKMKEVVVTYQAYRNTPVSYLNLHAATLKAKSTGQEPSFLLAETPGITAYSDAGSFNGYAYYRLRGIDQTRINTTLDGVPMNEPEDQGAYFSNYPDILNAVSKVQVQRGAGMSKNGVASYGGSVQLFSPDLHDSAGTNIGLGYGSFNSARLFATYNSGVHDGKAFYARASQVYSDGYKYNSGNNAQSAFVSAGLFGKKADWRVNILVGQQRNKLAWLGVSDSLIKKDPRTNANNNERDHFTQAMVQLQQVWRPAVNQVVQSCLYYTFLKGNYDFNLNGFLGLNGINELYNYAFQSNLMGFFSNYSITGKHLVFRTGVHGSLYNRQHTGSERSAGQLYQNKGIKNEVSVFSKMEYLRGPVTFFADVQYRHSSFDYKGSVPFQQLNWNFVNPTAGVSVQLNRSSLLYYSIARVGREPTRNDLFAGNDDLLADSMGNAMLSNQSPEFVVDQELGFRHQANRLCLAVNVYFMSFKNELVLAGKFGPNGLPLTNNVDQSIRTGLECTVAYRFNQHWSILNNSAFNYSRIKEEGIAFKPVLTPPVIINQEVSYTHKQMKATLSGRYQQRCCIDFANSATVDSYCLLNASLGFRMKGIEFTAFINNITNSRYFNNGYVDYDGTKKYFVQAPANFYLSVQYSF